MAPIDRERQAFEAESDTRRVPGRPVVGGDAEALCEMSLVIVERDDGGQ